MCFPNGLFILRKDNEDITNGPFLFYIFVWWINQSLIHVCRAIANDNFTSLPRSYHDIIKAKLLLVIKVQFCSAYEHFISLHHKPKIESHSSSQYPYRLKTLMLQTPNRYGRSSFLTILCIQSMPFLSKTCMKLLIESIMYFSEV